MKIAVLGGGHGCYAAAADLSDAGHEVRLWRRDAAALAAGAAGGIRIKDQKGARDVRIALASGDIGAVLRGAELVLIPSPAIAQDDIARAMAPHLVDGQVVYLPPGTFGSFTMDRIVRAAGNAAEVTYAETGTLPWLARKHGAAEVAITIRAIHLPTGVYPQSRSAHALAVISKAFPGVIEDCGDALSGALMNAGPIIHPPLILMNAAPLQHFERWDIHNEGTQPAVRAVTTALDAERMATREALGYGAPHFPLADHYDNDRWMYGDAHKKLTDSAATGARASTCTRTATCSRTRRSAWPSWRRWRVMPASMRRWRTACWRWPARSSAATCARARARWTRSAWPALSRAQLQALLRTGAAA